MKKVAVMVAQRLALGVLTLFVVSIIIFGSVELLPGDLAEAMLGQGATAETVEAFRRQLLLDLPPHERYIAWLGQLLNGDLGVSLANRRPIAELIDDRLYNTLFLAVFAAVVAVPMALVLGLLAAIWRNTFYDRAVNIGTLTAVSFPEFFIAYILVVVFAIQAGLFPAISNVSPGTEFWERVYRTTLPALTLTLVITAHMMRMTRAAIIDVLSSPYIEMARLKGVKPRKLVLRHALPNALAPIINVIAINLAYLVVGVVVVEVVFVYPGLGQLMVDSVSKRDLPVVQTAALIFAATYILLNLTADVMSILSNPRLLHPR